MSAVFAAAGVSISVSLPQSPWAQGGIVNVISADAEVAPHLNSAARLWNSYAVGPQRLSPVAVSGVLDDSLEYPTIGKATCARTCSPSAARWCCDTVVQLHVRPDLGVLAADVFMHEIGHVVMNQSWSAGEKRIVDGHWEPDEPGSLLSAVLTFPVTLSPGAVAAAGGSVCGGGFQCGGVCLAPPGYRRVPGRCNPPTEDGPEPWGGVAVAVAAGVVAVSTAAVVAG